MQTQWVTPSFVVLTWEEILESEGLQTLEADPRHVQLEDTHGVRIPAQPVRDGGMFWHSRSDIFHSKQDRNHRERTEVRCPVCEKQFVGTKRAKFCSTKCRVKQYDRRMAALSYAKLTKKGEETNQ